VQSEKKAKQLKVTFADIKKWKHTSGSKCKEREFTAQFPNNVRNQQQWAVVNYLTVNPLTPTVATWAQHLGPERVKPYVICNF